jgi:hypothetical protein
MHFIPTIKMHSTMVFYLIFCLHHYGKWKLDLILTETRGKMEGLSEWVGNFGRGLRVWTLYVMQKLDSQGSLQPCFWSLKFNLISCNSAWFEFVTELSDQNGSNMHGIWLCWYSSSRHNIALEPTILGMDLFSRSQLKWSDIAPSNWSSSFLIPSLLILEDKEVAGFVLFCFLWFWGSNSILMHKCSNTYLCLQP